jgi:hypothetical protein
MKLARDIIGMYAHFGLSPFRQGSLTAAEIRLAHSHASFVVCASAHFEIAKAITTNLRLDHLLASYLERLIDEESVKE